MTVLQLRAPVVGSVRGVQAAARNGVAIAFSEPSEIVLHLSDVIDVDLEQIGVDQRVVNLTTGQAFTLNIPENDVHDMRLPGGHGSKRFPLLARRRGA